MTNATKYPKITINQIKDEMRADGSHWWDADTMRFFGTTVASPVFNGPGGCYFVTRDGTGFRFREENSYGYTVRQYDPSTHDIDTIGSIADIDDEAEAIRTAKGMAAGSAAPASVSQTSETFKPATPRDDLRAAMKKAGIECTDETAAELMSLAKKVQKAAEDHCNKANFDPSRMYDSARNWLAKTFPGLNAKIGGDPRGATFKLILPNGETNDFGKEGYIVPTSNSLYDE